MTVATRKILLSGLLGVVSATSAISATGYAASQPGWVQNMSRPLLHETLASAIQNNDYQAFVGALSKVPEAQSTDITITHDQFDSLVAVHKLRVSQSQLHNN